MKIILSIKPEFAEKIFEGTKKFEFRRTLYKNTQVKVVVVYASAPISKIIGEFEIDSVLHQELDSLWSQTRDDSGITQDFYRKYFNGKERGYAIKVKKAKKYERQYCIRETFGLTPPQSFAYIREKPLLGS